MPDSFFAAAKPRKRKRSTSGHDGNSAAIGPSKKFARKGSAHPNATSSGKVTGVAKRKGKTADEELDSDQTNDEDGGIDDMDLRHGLDSGQEGSGEEDEEETPAEKRLRLAQLYLDSVREGLGIFPYFFTEIPTDVWPALADGEYDAAEIDKELISARLKQDVLEHSGKVHLFLADSVSSNMFSGVTETDHHSAYLVRLITTTDQHITDSRAPIICDICRCLRIL